MARSREKSGRSGQSRPRDRNDRRDNYEDRAEAGQRREPHRSESRNGPCMCFMFCTFFLVIIAVAVAFLLDLEDFDTTQRRPPPTPPIPNFQQAAAPAADAIHTSPPPRVTSKDQADHDALINSAKRSIDPYKDELYNNRSPKEIVDLDGYLQRQKENDPSATQAQKLNKITVMATEFREALRVKSALERQLENGLVEYSHKFSMATKIKERILEIQKHLEAAPAGVERQMQTLDGLRAKRDRSSEQLRQHELEIHLYPEKIARLDHDLRDNLHQKSECETSLAHAKNEVQQLDKAVDGAMRGEKSQEGKCKQREQELQVMVSEMSQLEAHIQANQRQKEGIAADKGDAAKLEGYKSAQAVVQDVEHSYGGDVETARGNINYEISELRKQIRELEQRIANPADLGDDDKDEDVKQIMIRQFNTRKSEHSFKIQQLNNKITTLDEIQSKGGIQVYKTYIEERIIEIVADNDKVDEQLQEKEQDEQRLNSEKMNLQVRINRANAEIEECNKVYKTSKSQRHAEQKRMEDAVEGRRRKQTECENFQIPISDLTHRKTQLEQWRSRADNVQDNFRKEITTIDKDILSTERKTEDAMQSNEKSIGDLHNELQVLRERSAKCDEHQRRLNDVKQELAQAYDEVNAVAQRLGEHNVWDGI